MANWEVISAGICYCLVRRYSLVWIHKLSWKRRSLRLGSRMSSKVSLELSIPLSQRQWNANVCFTGFLASLTIFRIHEVGMSVFFLWASLTRNPFCGQSWTWLMSLSSPASKDNEIHASGHFYSHNGRDVACSNFHIELILKVPIFVKLPVPGLAYGWTKFWTDVCFLCMFIKTTA